MIREASDDALWDRPGLEPGTTGPAGRPPIRSAYGPPVRDWVSRVGVARENVS